MKELRSEAARLLASARVRGPITCEICGTIFEGYTTGKKPGRYCSPPCQRKGYRITHREQERERKRRSRERKRFQAASDEPLEGIE